MNPFGSEEDINNAVSKVHRQLEREQGANFEVLKVTQDRYIDERGREVMELRASFRVAPAIKPRVETHASDT